jgi:hypothetical protein
VRWLATGNPLDVRECAVVYHALSKGDVFWLTAQWRNTTGPSDMTCFLVLVDSRMERQDIHTRITGVIVVSLQQGVRRWMKPSTRTCNPSVTDRHFWSDEGNVS